MHKSLSERRAVVMLRVRFWEALLQIESRQDEGRGTCCRFHTQIHTASEPPVSLSERHLSNSLADDRPAWGIQLGLDDCEAIPSTAAVTTRGPIC
jgi:hypothetical protein